MVETDRRNAARSVKDFRRGAVGFRPMIIDFRRDYPVVNPPASRSMGYSIYWALNRCYVWFPFLTRRLLIFSLLLRRFLIFLNKNKLKCLSIFYTLPLSNRPAHTSWRGLFSRQTVSSWTLSAQDAFKLPQSSAMPKLLSCVGTAISCSANPPAERPVSQKDAPTDARSIKLE